jgi:ADP-ribosylglycohydrolase
VIGAIAGDIIGSVYEYRQIKTKDFPLFSPKCYFTDDTVLTVAVAQAILTDGDYRKAVLDFGRRYPDHGYGSAFARWFRSPDPKPYGSWGNGSAMRVSPVGFAFETVDDVLREAARTAEFTHNHPEGIKGAQPRHWPFFSQEPRGTRISFGPKSRPDSDTTSTAP